MTMDAATVTRQNLVDFVVREARLLDDKRFEDWNALFTDDGHYWVPLSADQEDGVRHASYLHEDKLLRTLRIERLKNPRAHSQQPPSRCHHLLQWPTVECFEPAVNRFVVRSEFLYTELQGEDQQRHVGSCIHHLRVQDGELRMALKRVNLLDAGTALPAIQLFI